MRFERITYAMIRAVPEMADVGPFEAAIAHHPYLHCDGCGERLWWGDTTSGAEVYACRTCKRVCDLRRVP